MPQALFASVVSMFMVSYFLLNHDVAATISNSENILDGLSVNDIFAIKDTPMVIILYMIPVLIHRLVPVLDITWSFLLFTLVLLHVSMALCFTIIKNIPTFSSKKSIFILILYLYYVTSVIATIQVQMPFGQREHYSAIFITPYLFSIISLVYDVKLSKKIRYLVGFSAAIGFCLKPQFAMIFIASELFVMIYQGRCFAWLRPEAMTIGTFGIGYLIAWRAFYPAYFSELSYRLEILNQYTTIFNYSVISTAIKFSFVVILLFAFSYVGSDREYKWISAYGLILSITAILIMIQQNRAFSHHVYYVVFFIFLQAFILCRLHTFWLTLILLTLLTLFVMYADEWRPWRGENLLEQKMERRSQIYTTADRLAPYIQNRKVTVLSPQIIFVWPTLTMAGAKESSPERMLSFLEIVYRRHGMCCVTINELFPEEQYVQNKIIYYFLQKKPDMVLVFNFIGKSPVYVLRHFQMDSRFHTLWANYQLVTEIEMPLANDMRGQFELYQRYK